MAEANQNPQGQEELKNGQPGQADPANEQPSGSEPNKGGSEKPAERNPYEVELEQKKEAEKKLLQEKDNLNIALREAREKNKELKAQLDKANNGDPSLGGDPLGNNPDDRSQELEDIRKGQRRLEQLLRNKEADDEIAKYSLNPKDVEVLKHIMQTRVQSSGIMSEDVSNALVIFNKNKYLEQERQRQEDHVRNQMMAGASGSLSSLGGQNGMNQGGANVDPGVSRLMETIDPGLAKKTLERIRQGK